MKKRFNPYPLSDGREYKKFQFSLTTLMSLEIKTRTGTTYIPTEEPMHRDTSAAELIIEAACRKCDQVRGEYQYDSTILRKIREMDKQELLLAIHGYFDGELIIPVKTTTQHEQPTPNTSS
jgi:hypothetical protein